MKFLLSNWKKILKFALTYVLIVGLFQFVGSLICGIDLRNKSFHQETSNQEAVMVSFDLFGTVLAIWLFSASTRKGFVSKLGLNMPKAQPLVVGFLTGLIVMISGFTTLLITKQAYVTAVKFHLIELLISIYIFSIIALLEEILIRGYILNTLLQNYNKWIALTISALIFSAMHLFNSNIGVIAILNLFLAGLLLGIPALYTGNIWSSVALHFSWNFFQSLFGFNVSGKDLYSIINLRESQANIWNGGFFGYEASIYCILLQVIVIAFFYKVYNREKQISISFTNSALKE